jgi:anti-anti-sigma factor
MVLTAAGGEGALSEHRAREAEGCTVIDVAPSYSRQSFVDLLEMVKGIVASEKPRLLLNMAELPHINSEGIGLLVLVHDQCEGAGGAMVLCRVPKRVEHVLKLAGVLTFFDIHTDEAEGIAALKEALPEEAPAAEGEAGAAAPVEEEEEVSPADLAAVARELVRTTIRSRSHQEVMEFFQRRAVKAASLDEVAGQANIARLAAEHVMQDLVSGGLVVRNGELFLWQPDPEAKRKLDLFRRALADPKLRTRLLAWLYAEEKK